MKYLKDWGIDGWGKVKIDTARSCDVKLFYKPNELAGGFEFKVLEFKEQVVGEDEKYERIVDGIAFFDGLRHVNFGCDIVQDGYLNYPDPNLLVLVFQTLANLELEYCTQI
tara:strand:- start:109 stop:441 length:333 start_codon:yes stop_codon:yes gene_type:complete